MSHDHHGHDHRSGHGHVHDGIAAGGDERRLFWAMVLTGGFMLVEVAGGVLAGSLALLADAGHMLADSVALAMGWAAFRVGRRRPSDRLRSYGYHRLQVLAAFVNGITLIAIVAWIAVEAVGRFLAPVAVTGGLMLAVAAAGLVVNVASYLVLHGGSRRNLNVRGAAVHVLGDMLGSGGALVAALIIILTGWMPADPLLSIAVSLLVLRSAWRIVRHSVHILLEGTPDWLDVDALKAELVAAVPAVQDVHHVHAWMLTAERPLMTLHASVRPGSDYHATMQAIHRLLEERYDVGHATVQIEPVDACPDDRADDRRHAAAG